MAHEHDHGHGLGEVVLGGSRTGRRLRWAGAALVVLAAIGLVALWPRGDAPDLGVQPQEYVDATVRDVYPDRCPGIDVATLGCRQVVIGVSSGDREGSEATFVILDTELEVPDLGAGDRIVVTYVDSAPEGYQYRYFDQQRQVPMVALVVLFVLVVVAFGRWQGVRALVGLGLSVLLLVAFVVPALLRDEPAVLVALVAGVAIASLSLYLAHGFTTATSVALFGTVASLLLVTLLALVAVALAGFAGLSGGEGQVLSVTASALDLRGLLVAGIVVGALGSLDDVTVTQVSTVAALRRADPDLGPLALYREAIRVGRDHVASSVNTLVLAYAGASLPLLLFFAQSTQPVGRTLTREVVAVEIVRMLVGSVGLIASVPLTTGLAAWILAGEQVRTVPRRRRAGETPRWDDFAPDDAEA